MVYNLLKGSTHVQTRAADHAYTQPALPAEPLTAGTDVQQILGDTRTQTTVSQHPPGTTSTTTGGPMTDWTRRDGIVMTAVVVIMLGLLALAAEMDRDRQLPVPQRTQEITEQGEVMP